MGNEKCINCRYCKPPGIGQRDFESYLCRRNAPGKSIMGTVGWPSVESGDWCGEYKKKEDE
jgi:hypothetical protein